MDLGEGWIHVVRGGCIVKATTPHSILNPQPVTEAPEQPNMTATRKTAKPKKPAPRPAAAAKATSAKPTKKAPTSVKTVASKFQTNDLVATPQRPASVFEDISDLLDILTLQACVELTRRLLTSVPTLPPGAASPHAVLIPVILFVAEYGSTPWKDIWRQKLCASPAGTRTVCEAGS
jgi:hypothetical protein